MQVIWYTVIELSATQQTYLKTSVTMELEVAPDIPNTSQFRHTDNSTI